MLISCSSCHRQYDVEHLDIGDRARCHCGTLMTVPEPRPHIAQIHHCSACGGSIEAGSTECSYCGGGISLEERNLGGTCPECFARLLIDASYCMDCGVEIKPTKVLATQLESSCPRCEKALVHQVVDQGEYTECNSCGGLWIDESFFEEIVEARDLSAIQKSDSHAVKAGEGERDRVRYLKCPTCSTFMHRKNYAGCSGVIIDWCKGHGFWFDKDELARILQFVSEGGLDKSRRLQIEDAKKELRRTKERTKRSRAMEPSLNTGDMYRAGSDDLLFVDLAINAVINSLSRLFSSK